MRIQQMKSTGKQIIINWRLCYQVRTAMLTWYNAALSYIFWGWKLLRTTSWGNGPFNQRNACSGYLPQFVPPAECKYSHRSRPMKQGITHNDAFSETNTPMWTKKNNICNQYNCHVILQAHSKTNLLCSFGCSQSDHPVRAAPVSMQNLFWRLASLFLAFFWLYRLTVIRRCNKSMPESNSCLQSEQEVCSAAHRLCLYLHQGSGKRGRVWPSQMPQRAKEFLWESPWGFHQKDPILSM